ncbi:F-box/LRR-repeat protein 17 [Gastrophryne carolinensis]
MACKRKNCGEQPLTPCKLPRSASAGEHPEDFSKAHTEHSRIEDRPISSIIGALNPQPMNPSLCRTEGAPQPRDLSCSGKKQGQPLFGDMPLAVKSVAPHCSGVHLPHCTVNSPATGDKTREHPLPPSRDSSEDLSENLTRACVEDQVSLCSGGQTLHIPRNCHHPAPLNLVTGHGDKKSLCDGSMEHGQSLEDEHYTSKFSSFPSACSDHMPSSLATPCQVQLESQTLEGEGMVPCESIHVNQLPQSLLLKIFSHLSLNERCLSTSLVCKYWRDLCLDLQFWKQLDLSGRQQVKDNLLEKIASRYWNITEMNISDCLNVTDVGICTLAMNCSGLVKYTAYRCKQLSDSSLIFLATHCLSLQKVHVGNQDRLTDDALKQLGSRCRDLRDIHFGQCYKISDEGMVVIAKGCPKLQKIYMQENKLVTDRSVEAFAEHCPKLQSVGFMGCSVTSHGVIHLTRLKSLSSLDLRHITELDNETVMEIVKKCLNLTSLNLCLNRNIDDRCVEVIAKEGRRLKELYLVTCKITDHALIAIGRYSTSIETVDVGWCKEITDQGATLIAQSSKSIRYLGLMRCDQVNESTVEQLVQQYPHITFSTVLQDCKRTLERAYQMGWTPNASSVF